MSFRMWCALRGEVPVFDVADRYLEQWLGSELVCDRISFGPPSPDDSGTVLNLYLMQLAKSAPERISPHPPLKLRLDYLVSARADEPAVAHALLGSVLVRAADCSDFRVDFEPVPASTWAAFGVVPRPSFWLGVPVRHERTRDAPPMIRVPPRVAAGAMSTLYGCVVGPGDVPIPAAQVALGSEGRAVKSDRRGRFQLPVPSRGDAPVLLRVNAKGSAWDVRVDPQLGLDPEAPVVVRFEPASAANA